LSNAIKFTRPRQRAEIRIVPVHADGQAGLAVQDNGVGFKMAYAGKLFGMFQRLHRPDEFEGNGAGLAIVQRIAHKHGGRVWAEADPDAGATFYLTLGSGEAGSRGESATGASGEAGKRVSDEVGKEVSAGASKQVKDRAALP
jgi:light-regulated signal transduction histidine kinase (bacteriophytochrome)